MATRQEVKATSPRPCAWNVNRRLLQITVLSRYIDRWAKRAGRWAIDHRRAVMEMDEICEVEPMKKCTQAGLAIEKILLMRF